MSIRKFIPSLGIAALAAAVSVPSLAHTHLGTSARAGDESREVTLASDAKYLNVFRNETVKINAAGKTFTWRFDTLGTPVFRLRDIAPKDVGAPDVEVYVSEDPGQMSGS